MSTFYRTPLLVTLSHLASGYTLGGYRSYVVGTCAVRELGFSELVHWPYLYLQIFKLIFSLSFQLILNIRSIKRTPLYEFISKGGNCRHILPVLGQGVGSARSSSV